MADIKINDLTAITDPSSTDVLPIVDIGNDATKKVTIADLLENAGSGAEATPGISFDTDSDTGIYRPGGNRIGVCTAGLERIRIDANGRIIAGAKAQHGAGRVQSHTETSTNANFAALKYIDGSGGPTIELFKSRGATSGAHAIVSSGDYLGRLLFKGSNGTAYKQAAAINVRVDGTPGTTNDMPGRIEFETTPDGSASSQVRMVLDDQGQLGVGTTSPAERLHINGNATIDGSDVRISNNNDFSSTGRTANVRFQFGGNDGAAIKTKIAAGASSVSECVLDVMTGGGADGQRRLRIDEVGRICVGALPSAVASITNVDAGLIQTDGNIDIRYGGTNSDPGGARYLSFINNDTTLVSNQPMGGIRWVGNDSDNPSTDCASILAYNAGGGGEVSNIVFSNNGGTERMRINSNGRVGIGTAAPNTTLHVLGNSEFGSSTANVGSHLFYANRGGQNLYARNYGQGPSITAEHISIRDAIRVDDTSGNTNFTVTGAGSVTTASHLKLAGANLSSTAGTRIGLGDDGSTVKAGFISTFRDSTATVITAKGSSGEVKLMGTGGVVGQSTFTTTGDDSYFSANRTGTGNSNALFIGYDNGTEKFRVRRDGNVVAAGRADVGTTSLDNYAVAAFSNSAVNGGVYSQNNNTSGRIFTGQAGSTEVFVVKASGKVGVGVAAPADLLHIHAPSGSSAYFHSTTGESGSAAGDGMLLGLSSTTGYVWNYENSPILFATNDTERMRITSGGNVLVGTISNGTTAKGIVLRSTGELLNTRDGGPALLVNRLTDDGALVDFRGQNTSEGSISISGSTVSYNGGHLSRWSQLAGGVERTEILRGSVLSNLDEMCEWAYEAKDAVLYTEEDELPEGVSVGDVKEPARDAGTENNEQLNRMKVSDVEGDKNVSGVFQAWDDDDDTYINDFYCAMTGDFVIRIAQGTTVARGDLLMSAGDGTAKPQDDDIVRSKTIAKVTSTTVSTTYADGSYCVPCVLMAC